MSQWAVIVMKCEKHIVPFKDGYSFGHYYFRDCWCQPRVDDKDPHIVVHNDRERGGYDS